jgi:hypothetical protein
MNDWQAEQHRDECVIQQEIVTALEHARPSLTDDEFQLLAWAAGVREAFNQGVAR